MQAGINLGEARGFQPLPYSGRAAVETLDSRSGVPSAPGRYLYRVSGDTPRRGGCTNDTALSKYCAVTHQYVAQNNSGRWDTPFSTRWRDTPVSGPKQCRSL